MNLGDQDKRKLYQLLDADVDRRLRRLEGLGVALVVLSTGQFSAAVGGPSIVAAVSAVVHLF